MATITKRGDAYQYQAQIRRKGYPSQTRTFETLAEAERWAREIETAMDKNLFRDPRAISDITLRDALQKYLEKVTSTKNRNTQQRERNRIRLLQRHPLAMRPMSSLRKEDFTDYRTERSQQVGADAVRLELAIFSHLYTTAIDTWEWPLVHCMRKVNDKAKDCIERDRRLEGDEEKRLLEAIKRPESRAPLWLDTCVRLALETGMRAGEILTLEWRQVHLPINCIRLEQKINGSGRTVGLTLEAIQLLKQLPRSDKEPRVILGFYDTSGLDRAFKRTCKAAGIDDLRFHDLRHEVASRLAPLMPASSLAKVMGWTKIQMAMRYYNVKDHEMVELIRRQKQAEPTPMQHASTPTASLPRTSAPSYIPANAMFGMTVFKGITPSSPAKTLESAVTID